MAAQSLVRHRQVWFDSNACPLRTGFIRNFSPFVKGGGYLRSRRPKGKAKNE